MTQLEVSVLGASLGEWRRWRNGSALGGVAVVLMLAATAGCGAGAQRRDAAHLQGTVTIDGQPPPAEAQASIMFRRTQGGRGRSAAVPIRDGRYDSPETPLGPVKVFINIQQPTGRMVREGSGNPYPEVESLIAPEYGSGIDLEVAGDNLDQNFDLKPR